jgi:hypothetical protein
VWTGRTRWRGGCRRGRISRCHWPLYAAAAGQNVGPRGMVMFTNSTEPLALVKRQTAGLSEKPKNGIFGSLPTLNIRCRTNSSFLLNIRHIFLPEYLTFFPKKWNTKTFLPKNLLPVGLAPNNEGTNKK